MDVRLRQGGRRVNLALGVLLVAGALSGLGANTIGVNWPLDLIQIHAAAALGILLLAPWKSLVVRRGLRRPRRRRPVKWLSLTLLAAVLITIASGLVHSTGHLERVGPLTLMQIHVGAAVLAGVALVAHFVSHPVRPRRTDLDRRALLRRRGDRRGRRGRRRGLGQRGGDRPAVHRIGAAARVRRSHDAGDVLDRRPGAADRPGTVDPGGRRRAPRPRRRAGTAARPVHRDARLHQRVVRRAGVGGRTAGPRCWPRRASRRAAASRSARRPATSGGSGRSRSTRSGSGPGWAGDRCPTGTAIPPASWRRAGGASGGSSG